MVTKNPLIYLFTPGDRPERFDKAVSAGADVVILDLEDAIVPAAKDRARANIAEWANTHRELAISVAVRINDSRSAWWAADLAWLANCAIRTVMLPKAESALEVAEVLKALGTGGKVVALIETARGVQNVDDVAAAKGVTRLAFGTLDYAVDLDLGENSPGFAYAASRIALASRCADLAAPIAGVTPSIDELEVLRKAISDERSMGFGAKLAIHPKQIPVIRAGFQPTPAEIEWARRVLAAVDGAVGAVAVDGKMIDRPVIRKAEAILSRARL